MQDANGKVVAHPSSNTQGNKTKDNDDRLLSVNKEKMPINAFVKAGPGIKTSIRTAAFLSLAIPMLITCIVAYFPPINHLISAYFIKGKIELNINSSSDRAKQLTIISKINNIDSIIVNFNYGSAALIGYELVEPSDRYIEIKPIGKKYPDELKEKSDPNFPNEKPFRSAFQFVNLPKDEPVKVIFYFINNNETFTVDNIVRDGAKLVGENDIPFFIFPNIIYTVFVLISIGILIWLITVYYKIYRTASKLEEMLDILNVELVNQRSIAPEQLVGMPIAKFMDYCNNIIKSNSRINENIDFDKFLKMHDFKFHNHITGEDGFYLCVAPFNLLGNPTFARFFKRYKVLFLTLNNEDEVQGETWSRIKDIM